MVEYELPEQEAYPSSKPIFNKPQNEKDFLKDLFHFEEDIERLTHIWNGDEQNHHGDWIINEDPDKQMMNKKGIHWCKSKLKTFACKYYVVTSFNTDEINQHMNIHAKDINHELSKRWEEFGFQDKLDINSVWSNMVTSIHAIFKGSFADAQRKLLSTTNQYQTVEHKDTSPSSGWFNKRPPQGGHY